MGTGDDSGARAWQKPAAMTDIRALDGLSAIAGRYAGFIVDLWGVIHNGVAPFPAAVDCLQRLRAAGGRVLILSNAPRRVDSVVGRLREMGLPDACWDGVMSSGEATWQALHDRADPWHARLGPRCYHLGPERDASVREVPGLEIVDRIDRADFILNTGTYDFDETVADHHPVLAEGAERGLPMVCANPDLVVIVGEKMAICAGALAERYGELGGAVFHHGKPHRPIYETCRRRFAAMGLAADAPLLAIGDSLRTDIAGAVAMGWDSLLIAGGIHGDDLDLGPGRPPAPEKLARLCADAGVRPTAVLTELVW